MNYVYFILNNDKVKIGYTKNVKRRLKQLQTANGDNLILLGYIEGDKEVEHQLHQKFDTYRIRENGEWFIASEAIINFINENNLDKNVRIEWIDGKIYPCLKLSKIR